MWGRKKKRSFGMVKLVWLTVVGLLLAFLFRQSILNYLHQNPDTAEYVPGFVTTALERDLADWREEDLQARYQQLGSEVQYWQYKLTNAADQGQAKFEEIQANLNQAREALDETKTALDKLSEAGEGLKAAVTPDGTGN